MTLGAVPFEVVVCRLEDLPVVLAAGLCRRHEDGRCGLDIKLSGRPKVVVKSGSFEDRTG